MAPIITTCRHLIKSHLSPSIGGFNEFGAYILICLIETSNAYRQKLDDERITKVSNWKQKSLIKQFGNEANQSWSKCDHMGIEHVRWRSKQSRDNFGNDYESKGKPMLFNNWTWKWRTRSNSWLQMGIYWNRLDDVTAAKWKRFFELGEYHQFCNSICEASFLSSLCVQRHSMIAWRSLPSFFKTRRHSSAVNTICFPAIALRASILVHEYKCLFYKSIYWLAVGDHNYHLLRGFGCWFRNRNFRSFFTIRIWKSDNCIYTFAFKSAAMPLPCASDESRIWSVC